MTPSWRRLVVLAVALASLALPAAAAAGSDGLTRALERGTLTHAQYALERARSLFQPASVRARFGSVRRVQGFEATGILRELVLHYGELSAADKRAASAILSRPDDTQKPNELGGHYDPAVVASDKYTHDCRPTYCVSWVTVSEDAASQAFIDDVFTTMNTVWATEIGQLGFRPPKNDSNSPDPRNVNGLIDMYVKDLPRGLYGYCTTDDPTAFDPSTTNLDVSAYCVLDNDYLPSEFPGAANGLAALQVTAAHEFFHAVQYAYNLFQDSWLLESTAAWMEDRVYDDVNDNYQYLLSSALTSPGVALDTTTFDDQYDTFKYGGWLFFRSVTESLDDSVIRRIIELGGSPRELLSIYAVDEALKQRGSSFGAAFARFGAANVFPPAFYDEGDAYRSDGKQLQAPLGRPLTLSASRRDTGWKKRTLLHLTTGYGYLVPGGGVKAGAKVRVLLDLPLRTRGSQASLLLRSRGGALSIRRVTLNAAGDATTTVPFGTNVVVVLSNVNLRLAACNQRTPFSCGGVYRNDPAPFWFRAQLVQ